jgi:hypothetical protein
VNSGIQAKLFEFIKQSLNEDESIGIVLSDVLSLSTDAVYRRMRLETLMTIEEVRKLCIHFNISFDALIEMKSGNALFTYLQLNEGNFTIEKYLEGILNGLGRLKSINDAKLYFSINNVHFFQALNFPQIVRFRLFFWAKTHLLLPAFRDQKFHHEKISADAFNLGREILQAYNRIPSVEIVDQDMMRGFLRQVLYYLESDFFEDPSYAIFLADRVHMWLEHYKHQAAVGKKFIVGTNPPASGADLTLYLNDTINMDTTFYYEGAKKKGVYLTHNIMNYLHTTDEFYVKDSWGILDCQIANSSLISQVNNKERTKYFNSTAHMVDEIKVQFNQLIQVK